MHHIASLLIIAFSCLLIQQVSSAHIIVAIHDSPSLTQTDFGFIKSILRDGPKQIGNHIFSVITFDSTDAYLLLNQSKTYRFLETVDYLQQGNTSNETAPNLASVFELILKHFPGETRKYVVTFLFDTPANTQMAREAWSKMDITKTTFISVFAKSNDKAPTASTLQFLTAITKNETRNVRVCDHITDVDCNNIWIIVLVSQMTESSESFQARRCSDCKDYCSRRWIKICPQPAGCVCPKEKENKGPDIPIGGGGGGPKEDEKKDEKSKNGEQDGLSPWAIAGIVLGSLVIELLCAIGIACTCIRTTSDPKPYGGTRAEMARRMLLAQAMHKSSMPSTGPVSPRPPGFFKSRKTIK